MKEKLRTLLPHAMSVVVMLLVVSAYFFPQLQGKIIEQGDIIQSKAKSRAVVEYEEKTGERYIWNPGQFGGMPYLYAVPADSNLLIHARNLVRMGIPRPIGLFFSIALFSYLLYLYLGAGRWLSVGLALATALSTNNIILWKTGHVSKIEALQYAPLIILGLLLLYDKRKYLLGFGLFAAGLGLNLFARHPQMTYYLFMALICYGVFQLYKVAKSKEWRHFIKATLFVVLGIVLSLGTSASRLWSLQEHKESSMRGGQVLQTEQTASTNSSSGLDWDYAMQWSNGWKDAVASYIPGFVGGGSGQEVGEDSATYQSFRLRNAPLYWGTLPFTEAPIYLGAVVIFLFLFSFFLVRSKHKWWILAAVILTLLLSGGSNLSMVNRPFFDYLPFFNSWRAPSSVLAVTVFLLPLMIALGLKELSNAQRLKSGLLSNDSIRKSFLISAGISIGTCLVILLFGTSIFSFEAPGDIRYTQQNVDITPFIKDRQALMRADTIRTLLFVLAATGLIWFWIKGKVGNKWLNLGLVVILIIDLVGVNLRYLGPSDYESKRAVEQTFDMRDVDRQIKEREPDRSAYRVMDVPNFGSSLGSYYHNTLGGYDAVKMRRYQDLIDRHISQNNRKVLNMLNTKYFITSGEDGQLRVSENPDALGPAWFVSRVVSVNSPNEEIDALTTFDPASEAVILTAEFSDYLEGMSISPDSNATINMVSYTPDRIEYQTSSSGDQLAVFSETWFGPDKGWEVTIDGEESDFIRANYDLRAMRVPAGDHTIVFEFRPDSFYIGEKISLFSSAIVLLLLGFSLYRNRDFLLKEDKKAPEKTTKPVKRKKKKRTGNAGKTSK